MASCQKDDTQATDSIGNEPISLAKSIFERRSATFSLDTATLAGLMRSESVLLWDDATLIENGDSSVVYIPVMFTRDLLVAGEGNSKDHQLSAYAQATKVSGGDWVFTLYSFLPEEVSSDAGGFSGLILTEDWFSGQIGYTRVWENRILRKGEMPEGRLTMLMSREYQAATIKVWGCVNGYCRLYDKNVHSRDEIIYIDPSGGGGGGNGSNSANTITGVAVTAPLEAFDLQDLLNCFDAIPTTGSTVFTVQLHVHLPSASVPGLVISSTGDPGHAYLTLSKTTGNRTYQLSFGFYPKHDAWIPGIATAAKNTVASGIGNESANPNRRSDISYAVAVSAKQFESTMNSSRERSREHYNLSTYNCAHYALEVFNTVLSDNAKLTVPKSDIGYVTPAGVYKKLNELRESGNNKIKKETKKPPLSSKKC